MVTTPTSSRSTTPTTGCTWCWASACSASVSSSRASGARSGPGRPERAGRPAAPSDPRLTGPEPRRPAGTPPLPQGAARACWRQAYDDAPLAEHRDTVIVTVVVLAAECAVDLLELLDGAVVGIGGDG